eukprot:TRINITY_DN12052_c0_g1_i1.p1 TRINITY_DN12052_c0_g1~~TRINITY_DN12052_c0_g1_i1.p1  ORF type:complete len:250 (-),score=68.95 TRINITY_DN12052_c0_g1_i1:155-838(-)
MEKRSVHYIRHARTFYNEIYESIGVGNCVDPKLMDSELSEVGHTQAKKLLEDTKDMKVDLIIVSGLTRSIQTALEGFAEEHHHKIIIEPSFAEKMEDSCDIGTVPALLAHRFPQIPIEQFKKLPTLWWYVDAEFFKPHQSIIQDLERSWEDVEYYKALDKQLKEVSLKGLMEGHAETYEHLWDRVDIFQKFLNQRPESNIVVVGHGEFLRELTSQSFKNCQIYHQLQ